MECSYDKYNNDFFSCSFQDIEGYNKEAKNISFIYVDSKVMNSSSIFFPNMGETQDHTTAFKYAFSNPVICRTIGYKSSTVHCYDLY